MQTQENGKITLFYSFSILTITIEVQPLITTIWDFRKQLILEKQLNLENSRMTLKLTTN